MNLFVLHSLNHSVTQIISPSPRGGQGSIASGQRLEVVPVFGIDFILFSKVKFFFKLSHSNISHSREGGVRASQPRCNGWRSSLFSVLILFYIQERSFSMNLFVLHSLNHSVTQIISPSPRGVRTVLPRCIGWRSSLFSVLILFYFQKRSFSMNLLVLHSLTQSLK